MNRVSASLDVLILRFATREHRLIGLSILRIIIGAATVLFCLADYGRREFLWGPTSYYSPAVARKELPPQAFSLFLWSNSSVWFEILFHLVIVTSIAFMIFGGRTLTLAQAVLMWSLHNRNQDVLEGGDNLAQILIIFMLFTVTNAYFAPGAANRRRLMQIRSAPSLVTLVHNLAAFLIVFQTCVLYFMAGYWKITGAMWQNGVAMYYISHITAFDMSSRYSAAMSNAFVGTLVCYFTIFCELAFPFAVLSARAWIRKANILAIEGMHAGIMVFMGLVCFGLLMIGADSACLRDDDYLALRRRIGQVVKQRAMNRRHPSPPAPELAPEPRPAGSMDDRELTGSARAQH